MLCGSSLIKPVPNWNFENKDSYTLSMEVVILSPPERLL